MGMEKSFSKSSLIEREGKGQEELKTLLTATCISAPGPTKFLPGL